MEAADNSRRLKGQKMNIPEYKVFQRGKTFWIRFSYQGTQHRVSTSSTKFGLVAPTPQGDKIVAEYLRGLSGQFDPLAADARTVFDKFISIKIADDRSPATIANYERYIKRFLQFFAKNPRLHNLTRFDIEEWKNWLLKQRGESHDVAGRNLVFKSTGKPKAQKEITRQAKNKAVNAEKKVASNRVFLAKKTVKEHLVFLSTVCKEFKIPNPVEGVSLPSKTVVEKQKELKFYTRDQIKLILETAKELKNREQLRNRFVTNGGKGILRNDATEAYWWLVFISGTGCRAGEAFGIAFEDWNPAESTVFLVSDKRDIGRTIKLSGIAMDEEFDGEITVNVDSNNSPAFALSVLKHIAMGHYKELGIETNADTKIFLRYAEWLYKKLETITKRCGLEFLGIHALRHSFITEALKTWNIAQLAKHVGHSDINTTFATYGHLTTDEVNSVSW